MAQRTLAENVTQVKADFKAVKDAVPYVFNDNPPTSEYGERIFTEISSLQYQADSAWDQGFNNGIEQGRVEGLEQGIEQGKQEVISNSKYIKKQASGKLIALNDVSEVYHNVVVKADTPTEVKVYGANILSDDVYDATKWILYSVNSYRYQLFFPEGVYTISAKSTADATYLYLQESTDNTTFTEINKLLYSGKSYGTCTFTIEKNKSYYLWSSATKYFANISEVQLEVGFNATEYEPYKGQTITATAEGTEVASICPTMTFLADSEITVDYYSSYGKAEAELAMWMHLTNNGIRGNYMYAFAYTDYTGLTIPNGLCKPKGVLANMFYSYNGLYLPEGVDCSGFNASAGASYQPLNMFSYSRKLKRIYDVGIPVGVTYNASFNYCDELEEIEIIRCNENTVFNANSFGNCPKLVKVKFEGTIASNINLQWSSKLDLESLISLFECLKHFGGSGNEYTKTITLSPESWDLTNREEFITRFDGFGGQDVAHQKGWNYA